MRHSREEHQMSFTPEHSAIRVTPSLEELISAAQSQAEVQAILRDAAKTQGVVRPDAFDPNVLHAVETPVAHQVGKVVVLNGVKHSLVAPDEESLRQQELDVYRQALS